MAVTPCGAVTTDRQGRELIDHGTPLFPLACYHDNISEVDVPWHWHDELEALVVETGTARVAVNGTGYVVKRGEGVFVNAGVLHGVWPVGEEPCRLRSVVFHPRLVGGGVDSILWQKYLEPLLANPGCPCVHFSGVRDWDKRAIAAIQAAWQAVAAEGAGFEFTAREQLSQLIFLLFQNCPRAERRPAEKTLRDERRIKTMLQYIQARYAEELTLAQIARSAHLSENECLRCFRAMLGCSPIQYLKQLRVQKAAELLISTDQKISDIGGSCGFQEMSYFARVFRELKGCTPSAFRKSMPRGETRSERP